MASSTLSPEQTRALLDILMHHETYAEIESFKHPETVTKYGFPFSSGRGAASRSDSPASAHSKGGHSRDSSRGSSPTNAGDEPPSESPILQTMVTRFVLRLPAIKTLPREFYSVGLQGLLARLGEAELSESYDKGALGTRKTLSTGSSSFIEMLGRGAMAGVPRKGTETNASNQLGQYDHSKAEDLERAWDDVVQACLYGNLAEEIRDHLIKTPDLEAYSPTIAAAADYVIYHLATFCHHIFVQSPEGQYLIRQLENLHGLVPYKMVRQTLRVGNAATMINGIMRLLLAKISVVGLTNFVGLTKSADDGMNLLQRIISLMMSWDASEFKKSAERIEKAKERPSDDVLQTIRRYINEVSRADHEAVRRASQDRSQSIVATIIEVSNPSLMATLDETTHAQCLEYYSALLSVRDREAITSAFCKQTPDLLTNLVRDSIGAYDPIIRSMHANMDLRELVQDGHTFMGDVINTSKPKKASNGGEPTMPSVQDYVVMLHRNKHALFKLLHGVAANCPEVRAEMDRWVKDVFVRFREDYNPKLTWQRGGEAKGMHQRIDELFASLPPQTQQPVLESIDAHLRYLGTLRGISHHRFQTLLDAKLSDSSDAVAGPGIYLARWQSLLDETKISPNVPHGPVQHGRDVKHKVVMGKAGIVDTGNLDRRALNDGMPQAPDVSAVIREMGPGFLRIAQELGGPDL
ncbi:hypothetical protein S7711_03323 [Stachybotrys chartarum IBT 7711]|uniref:Uncharacterized protein n=1 Tax=Stachybotrys chartarum (strain CBS 109288 / IBT 7711) TaxID=1280523 RepID=A0A084AUP3_STACB|nr:hypothetical protein S7711_03323 [Stachybotrys chartarum IBT 7711]KFA52762.1 hypothetical protein S40293_00866 [Stachybotrys chartarum IBT 40293]